MSNSVICALAILRGNCPNGGNHTPGTSGEWKGRCTKCGTTV